VREDCSEAQTKPQGLDDDFIAFSDSDDDGSEGAGQPAASRPAVCAPLHQLCGFSCTVVLSR
jgi:hypothetical protein